MLVCCKCECFVDSIGELRYCASSLEVRSKVWKLMFEDAVCGTCNMGDVEMIEAYPFWCKRAGMGDIEFAIRCFATLL